MGSLCPQGETYLNVFTKRCPWEWKSAKDHNPFLHVQNHGHRQRKAGRCCHMLKMKMHTCGVNLPISLGLVLVGCSRDLQLLLPWKGLPPCVCVCVCVCVTMDGVSFRWMSPWKSFWEWMHAAHIPRGARSGDTSILTYSVPYILATANFKIQMSWGSCFIKLQSLLWKKQQTHNER